MNRSFSDFLLCSRDDPPQHCLAHLNWKWKVSFSGHLFICLQSVNLITFSSSFKNHRADFNQTWQKACFLAHLSRTLKWAFLIEICQLSIVVVNFSHFHLLLQNHWANFNHIWHKASMNEGDLSLFIYQSLVFNVIIISAFDWFT